MRLYTRYRRSTGKIVGCRVCSETTYNEGHCPREDSETRLITGKAVDDGLHKVDHGKIVKKSAAEILADNPPRPAIPDADKPARMTKKQLADLLKRVKDLEDRATGNP